MKKIKPYLYIGLIITGILSLIFIIKGIFPFGKNSLIWGDMHDQITAFYYHFYDFIYNKGSLFYNFRIGGGIAFFGIIAYYILSPFSILTLLVPRDYIYLMMSVIVALKIILTGITCLYFIRTYFKKVPYLLQIFLALAYAFSGYALMMYQITSWIDAMYMLPLVMIGLKKVLDLEKPTYYIVTLTLSLIFNFYVSLMSIIFIFFGSIIYIFVYKKKEDRKKSIASLGISTILSLLISSFVVIPAYMQIGESSRIGFDINSLLNSRLGPITDKASMLMFGGIIYVGLFFLLVNFKKHKEFLKFYIPTILLLGIPFVVEPVNKILHFGSYASFPCRFGYLLMFFLIIGAGYYFNNYEEKNKEIKNNKIISIVTSLGVSGIILLLSYKFSNQFQTALHGLTLSSNPKLVVLLMIMLLVSIVGIYIIIKINKNLNKLVILTIGFITISSIFGSSYLYIGLHKYNVKLNNEYKVLIEESHNHDLNDIYRAKTLVPRSNSVTNNGFINKISNLDYFSSLSNRKSLEAYKKLGFSSVWVETHSSNSTLFMDAIMGNKYIITDKKDNIDFYKLSEEYDNQYLYKTDNNISFGFKINENDTIFDKNNSFEIANSLYRNILNTEDNIFTIDSDFEYNNVNRDVVNKYSIQDKSKEASITKTVNVIGKQNLYIEVINELSNYDNININRKFDLYINNKLVAKDSFSEPENGSFNIGIFEDEIVDIKIILKDTATVKGIYLGQMSIDKYLDFLDKYYLDTNITYNRDKINAKVDGKEGEILFLPINYSKDFKAYNNGKEVEVIELYENFIGIKLNNGENDIAIKYVPNDVIKCSIISIIALILTIILIKTNLYNKLINNRIINNSAYYIYVISNIIMIIGIYVLLSLVFLVSFIKYIRI